MAWNFGLAPCASRAALFLYLGAVDMVNTSFMEAMKSRISRLKDDDLDLAVGDLLVDVVSQGVGFVFLDKSGMGADELEELGR